MTCFIIDSSETFQSRWRGFSKSSHDQLDQFLLHRLGFLRNSRLNGNAATVNDVSALMMDMMNC